MSDLTGVGLGLRKAFLNDLLSYPDKPVDFLEIAPENWIKTSDKRKKILESYLESYPFVLHGLSLSIGSAAPLNIDFIRQVKMFMDHYQIETYSDHLTYSGDGQGYLYDLLPIPFTEEAVHYVSQRINQVQDIIEHPLVLENASYYAAPGQQLSEIDFLNAIISQTGCQLLLDVNNVYVNSQNHHYDPKAFIRDIPTNHIAYLHIAGHLQKEPELIIDTHGADIIDEVFNLLDYTYQVHGSQPTLLERDFNIPPLPELLTETQKIQRIQQKHQSISTSQPSKAHV